MHGWLALVLAAGHGLQAGVEQVLKLYIWWTLHLPKLYKAL
jgi:hypothetical protein